MWKLENISLSSALGLFVILPCLRGTLKYIIIAHFTLFSQLVSFSLITAIRVRILNLFVNKCYSSSPDGFWDPERWFYSFNLSRGNSPLNFSAGRRDSGGDRKRPAELDRDLLFKRRSSGNDKPSHFII